MSDIQAEFNAAMQDIAEQRKAEQVKLAAAAAAKRADNAANGDTFARIMRTQFEQLDANLAPEEPLPSSTPDDDIFNHLPRF